jgi:zinc protease
MSPGVGPAKSVHIDRPVTQASIALGHRGVARDNPDFETLSVMNYILGGGGFSSRLMENIRTKAGLAYSVGSFFSVNRGAGTFQIVMQTKNASAADAVARARAELERIRNEGVTDEEVNEAKRYLTGSFPLRLDSTTKIAQFLGQITVFGLGIDYEALTEVIVAALTEAKLPPAGE